MAASPSNVSRSRLADETDEITRNVIRGLEDGLPPWLPAPSRLRSTSGLPPSLIVRRAAANAPLAQEVEAAFHELFAATGLDFEHGAIRTFYAKSRDAIIVSDWRNHPDLADFYRDWIHEILHATAHPARLGRDLPPMFGSRVDPFEDLVAEMGSALVCTNLGIAPALRHADGVPAWIALLQADSHAWFRALRLAKQAADYLFALRDAQSVALDAIDAEEAEGGAVEKFEGPTGLRTRQSERRRWAFGAVTGLRPGESLPAARSGDLP